MNLHANAALSWTGRKRLCELVVVDGWTVSAAAAAAGVSVRCARKWVGRYRLEGLVGLHDLAEISIEAGELGEAQALLERLPCAGLPATLATVLIPAARGRLALAQDRPADGLDEFETCLRLLSAPVWGMQIHDRGHLHVRSGAALALLRLGERERARELADTELGEARAFGAPRALGIALRVAGLTRAGEPGLVTQQRRISDRATRPTARRVPPGGP